MKTYEFLYVLLAVLLVSCTQSDDDQTNDEGQNVSVDVDYSILLTSNGVLTSQLLDANLETILLNPNGGPFETTAIPQITYRDGTIMTFYHKKPDCSGEIIKFWE